MAEELGRPAKADGLSSLRDGAANASPPKASIPDADYEDEECGNCGGEGFVYGCSWDWQCDTWDGDSCLCTRRCEWCQPVKPDTVLKAVLAEALTAQAGEAGTAETAQTGSVHEHAVGETDAPKTFEGELHHNLSEDDETKLRNFIASELDRQSNHKE